MAGETSMTMIGIMQGRLLPPVNNAIQAFPQHGWQSEFALAAEIGLDCIEFIFDGDEYTNHPLMTRNGLREVQHLILDTGVRVRSVCADYFMPYPLHRGTSDQLAARGTILQDLILNCSTLDIGNIIVPCVDNSRLRNENERQEFKFRLEKCLPIAEECGINIALETDLGPDSFADLVQEIDHDCLKINYDTGNSASLGYDPAAEFASYGKWITDVHIKDRVLGGTTVPLGEGSVDFPLVFTLLDRLNYSGIFILQTARKEPGRELETIKGYLDFIGKYFA